LDQIEQIVEKGISFDVAEYIVLGTNHAEIGARILQHWSLPLELVNAVNWHHDPESCRHSCVLSDVVHVADVIGRMIGYGKGRNGQQIEPAAEVAERLGLTAGRMEQLAEQTLREVARLSDLLA
jgi:HD-like signal output (HDOD) protein